MIKLANKIALASLFGTEYGMKKSAGLLAIPVLAGALAGGLVGNSQRNDDDSPWKKPLKPALGALTGAAVGVPGGLAGYDLGLAASDKLGALERKIKNKKAKAILAVLRTPLSFAGLAGGGAGAGALSGLGTSKLLDL